MARNLLRQQAGAGRRRQRLAGRIAALSTAADLTAWDAGHYVIEREAALEVLTSLPERDIEALTLIAWHGLDASEAAAAAGCSPRAFTVRLHRARRRLTRALRSADQACVLPLSAPAAGEPGSPKPFPSPSTAHPSTAHPMEQS